MNVYHWNPKRVRSNSKYLSFILPKKPLNNFGDLIGPIVIREILDNLQFEITTSAKKQKKILSVGSVLHFAQNGDVIWGTGKNGKINNLDHKFDKLDVRAVRGPLTREFLLTKKIETPEIYGDPALLLPFFFPHLKEKCQSKKYSYTIIPNFNDFSSFNDDKHLISPLENVWSVIERILQSNFVIGSSLHAIIVAEAFGVPARLIQSSNENRFKYEDYYLGTGRGGVEMASNVSHALELGGESKILWDSNMLLKSFPFDLWGVHNKYIL